MSNQETHPPYRTTVDEHGADVAWMQVRSIEPDRATGTVGAVLTDRAGARQLFVPLDRNGTPRTRPIEHGFSLLLDVIAGVGAELRHVELSLADDGREHATVGTASLVLTDASTVRCHPAKALALSVHAGVPVRLSGDVPSRLVVTAVPARERPDAVRLPA